MKNRLIVFVLSLCLLAGAAIRGSPASVSFAAEEDRKYAPMKQLSVTYVKVLSLAWPASSYYEDDLEDMITFIEDRGADNTFVFRYYFELDSLCDVVIKYRASLRKTKYGSMTVKLAENALVEGSTIIENRHLDWNEGYWIGRLPQGVYYLKVPVVIESAGLAFFLDGWRDNPYMRFDITARRVPLFGGKALMVNLGNLKTEIKERADIVYGNFRKI